MTALEAVPESNTQSNKRTPPAMLDRMTTIMDCFESHTSSLTLDDVYRWTGLPRSTTHRILVDLVRLGWLRQVPGGYSLGPRLFSFSGTEDNHSRLRESAADILHDVAMRTGLVVHLAVPADSEIVYLDKVGGRFANQMPSRVGGRAPAHSTALGKAMLAWWSPEDVDNLIGPALGRLTARTICRLSTLHQELRRIRERKGLAFERAECFTDVACVASAIRSGDGPVASISVAGAVDIPLERVAPLVAFAARKTSETLYPEIAETYDSACNGTTEALGCWSSEALDSLLAMGSGVEWM